MQIHVWRSRKTGAAFCWQILKSESYNGKWMKSFSALKVLTQSTGHFNGSPNGMCAVWRWAALPVCWKEPHLGRHPVNFMLYLGTLHILCLPCQTSFLPLIRRNGKYLTAAQISVISLWNRFRNGERCGPAVATCRSDIRCCRFILDHNITLRKGEGECYTYLISVNLRSMQM